MNERYEEAVTIRIYEDLAAEIASDELEYACLCDGCAEDRGSDVNYLSTVAAGEFLSCEECYSPNRDEDEEEEENW
jgi:hypothetical protein